MKIDSRQRFLLITTLVLFLVLVADQVVLEPLAQAWTARSERITELRKKLTDGTLLLQREDSLRKRWRSMRTNTLSNNPSLAEQQLLKAFDAWAQESRVNITRIAPQWKHDTDDYLTLGSRVDAAGDLSALSRFLHNVAKSPLALRLESVELIASDTSGQELTLGLRLSGLVLASGGTP